MVKKKEVIMFVKRVLLPVVLILVTVYIGMGQFLKKPEGSFVTNQQPSMNFPNMEAVERERISLIEKVSNGVVTIYTTQEVRIQNPFFDIPFGDFLEYQTSQSLSKKDKVLALDLS